MTSLALVSSSPLTMSSIEIAELVESNHGDVKRSIKRLADKRVIQLPPTAKVEDKQSFSPNNKTEVYVFSGEQGKRDSIVVVAQLSPEFTARLVDRWQELESGKASPKISDPTLAALVQTVVEIDRVKQQQFALANQQTALARKAEILENRVQNVELQHRNGVPDGHLSKKQAHHLYGEGLSEEIFHLAMAKAGVTIKNYIHRGEDGYDVATFAYLESEIQAAVWTVPAERMKAGREHRVPLSGAAMAILEAVPRVAGCPLLFPGARQGRPISNMAMLQQMRGMGYGVGGDRGAYVPHGFRSAFRDWAGEVSSFPRDVCEMALAHTIDTKVEAAYRRGDLFEKRRKMMDAWADWCIRPGADVIELGERRRAT